MTVALGTSFSSKATIRRSVSIATVRAKRAKGSVKTAGPGPISRISEGWPAARIIFSTTESLTRKC